ncbi:hypothetical protein PMM47T1_16820 [Pseudomonas sp. M47T1]|uniref:DUF4946 domain-containing protein n=2 Tax=unclassified Pseudomonas TaxID=196821 RepID=UPI00026089C7|nr:DUF4946 domain-containing protein [Pseudomonas sp. M47T1]EIK95471.1 hypothetical protein PMM47T1_16820 [Pseudomonas sp. M47T1]
MNFLHRGCTLIVVGLLLAAPVAMADEVVITWPAGWDVQTLPDAADPAVHRQRAAKNDANGDPLMVVELTRTALAPDHQVNLGGVVLEMRKALQINFSHGGYQSVCTKVHDSKLGDIAAVETTCQISLNGGHVMTQTLVAASTAGAAYSLSYAGSAQGYSDNQAQVQAIRDGLKLQTP